jgi:cellulose synthase/poly-beta-1,6-N-acetylglucosamine synthase-like glycosyltransferase
VIVEFMATLPFLGIVFLRIKEPWTEFVDQIDGPNNPAWQKCLKVISDYRQKEEQILNMTKPKKSKKNKEGLQIEDDDDKDAEDITIPLSPKAPKTGDVKVDIANPKVLTEAMKKFTVRMFIPCYKESIEIVKLTALSALSNDWPEENLYVYILDDGNDKAKAQWVKAMKKRYPNLMYVVRPQEFKGHGKAGNLNYCAQHVLYPQAAGLSLAEGEKVVPSTDLIGVLDADMIASPDMVKKLVPYFAADDTAMIVQTPQSFYNVPPESDFFDAHNVSFFQYLQPGYNAWNTATCCGTNFLVRASHLARAGFWPYETVNEDFGLAVRLHMRVKGRFYYHAEHVAFGEAPEDMREIFQQRSRWAKGNVQIFIKENPLFNKELTWIQRITFFNMGFCYFSTAFLNPIFVLSNLAGMLFGLFPVGVLGFGTGLIFLCFYMMFYFLYYFTPVPESHMLSLWIMNKQVMYFGFLSYKALMKVFREVLGCGKQLVFKATRKDVVLKNIGGGANAGAKDSNKAPESKQENYDVEKLAKKRDSSRRDIYFHWIACALIIICCAYGVYILLGNTPLLPNVPDERSQDERTIIQLFCLFWSLQYITSYGLPIVYTYTPNVIKTQAFALRLLFALDQILFAANVLLTGFMLKLMYENNGFSM